MHKYILLLLCNTFCPESMKTRVHTLVSDKKQSSSQTKEFMYGLVEKILERHVKALQIYFHNRVHIIHICIIYIPCVNQRM